LTKKTPAPIATPRPYFKCFPSNFLQGCFALSPDEKAVYYTLIMKLYDGWSPIDDRTKRDRAYLAGLCGVSARNFFEIRDRLIASGKLFRTPEGLLSNRRFERARASMFGDGEIYVELIPPKNEGDKSDLNRGINAPTLNENKDLTPSHARASPESIVQSSGRVAEQGLGKDNEKRLEGELTRICRALGVDLQADTRRAAWPMQLVRLKAEHGLDVELDILPAIESYGDQPVIRTMKSLMYLKDRALEKKAGRLLADRLAGITRERHAATPPAELTDLEWFKTLKIFLRTGVWDPAHGPSPLQPGCLAPRDLITKAKAKWIEQGNHPVEMTVEGVGSSPWQPHSSRWVREATPFAD
jgi:hypothetical protein